MSVLAEPIVVPLPQEAKLSQPKRAGPMWDYWRKTKWLYSARVALKVMAYGLVLNVILGMLSIPSVHSKIFLLAMNAHPLVMASTAHSMPVWLFFGIAVVRRMVPAPINYVIGGRSVYLVEASIRKYGESRWYIRATVWLMSQSNWTKLIAVFGLTIYSPPMPPMSPNVYTFAGATKMKFWYVMAADAAGTLVVVLGCYMLGKAFNPLTLLQWCF
jgi:membrane protein DedA with SNARE-associated domain